MDDFLARLERVSERNLQSGPCDDDYETTCPYVGILPDETEDEEPSPLSF